MFSNCHHNSLFCAGSILGTTDLSNLWGELKKEQQLENCYIFIYFTAIIFIYFTNGRILFTVIKTTLV